MSQGASHLSLLTPSYKTLTPLTNPREWFRRNPTPRGSSLVWHPSANPDLGEVETLEERPGGLALIVVLPTGSFRDGGLEALGILERCRPHSVLPNHARPEPEDLAALLSRPPAHLSVDLVDYLLWRGVDIDSDTRHLIRRSVELSHKVKTTTALARGLYLSRRAFGRRMKNQGLPVPSHWLQFSRVLRATIKLQNSSDSLYKVGTAMGYPDGFTLSNQMMRLTGVRPSEARALLGWEWLVESWLRREQQDGRLARPLLKPEPDCVASYGIEGERTTDPAKLSR